MSGFIALFFLIIWIYFIKSISSFFVSGVRSSEKKSIAYWGICMFFFILPVLDDIAGGLQFRSLCEKGINPVYNPEKIKGKTVQLKKTQDRLVKGIVPIREQVWDWVNAETGETLVLYKNYYASGGWLSRSIRFPEGSPPYTFDGSCNSKEINDIFKKYNVIVNVKQYFGE